MRSRSRSCVSAPDCTGRSASPVTSQPAFPPSHRAPGKTALPPARFLTRSRPRRITRLVWRSLNAVCTRAGDVSSGILRDGTRFDLSSPCCCNKMGKTKTIMMYYSELSNLTVYTFVKICSICISCNIKVMYKLIYQ